MDAPPIFSKPWMRVTPEAAVRLVLAAAVILIYWPVTDHGFVTLDDPDYVTANRHVRSGVTAANLRWALTATDHGNWHPLTWMSHMLDAEIFGLRPGGHHLTNLLLHLCNTLLLFTFFRRATGAPWRSAVVAALFACHPLNVESVAWVAERKNLLSAFFFFLTLLAYTAYSRRPRLSAYLLVLAPAVCGLMSKPALVTLPCVLLLLDFWPLGRPEKSAAAARLVAEKLPLLALCAAVGAVTLAAQGAAGALGPLSGETLPHRLGNALVAYASYFQKTVWPADLGVFYPHPGLWSPARVAGAFLVLTAVSVVVLVAGRRAPSLAAGWLWYLGTLVPVIGVVQAGAQSMADRYAYIPSVGLFVMAAWGGRRLVPPFRPRQALAGAAAGLALVLLGVTARGQVGHWKDSRALYEHTLAVTGENAFILNSLGVALAAEGRIDAAVRRYREALEIDPGSAEVLHNLGGAHLKAGRASRALEFFEKALAADPGHAAARLNLGRALEALGENRRALAAYEEALAAAPRFVEAAYAAANLLAASGRLPEAEKRYRQVLDVDPHEGRALVGLALIFDRTGRSAAAAGLYRRALAATPALEQAHNNYGNLLLRQGEVREAAAHYLEALRLNPRHAEAGYNMGVVMERLEDFGAAASYYREALRIRPDFAAAHFNLGALFLRRGEGAEAVRHFEAALRLRPGDPRVESALAAARALRRGPGGDPER